MPNVTYLGTTYPCAKALKGEDYIHLLDSNGCMIVAFDGIKDFSGFTIDTDWTAPTPEGECYIAVIGDDGVIRKGGHRCCDINVIGSWNTGVTGTTILPESGLYEFKTYTTLGRVDETYPSVMVNFDDSVRYSTSAFFGYTDNNERVLKIMYFEVAKSGLVTLKKGGVDGIFTDLSREFSYRKLADA